MLSNVIPTVQSIIKIISLPNERYEVEKVIGNGRVCKFTDDRLLSVSTCQTEQDMFKYHQIFDNDKDVEFGE